MKVLITGGLGFLGSNLASEAINQGMELLIIDNKQRVGSNRNMTWLTQLGRFKFLEIDTRDADAINSAIRGFVPNVVFHLAGQVAMTTSIANPRDDFSTNVVGGITVLEAIRNHSPQATVVFSSTNKVYGDLEWVEYLETDTRFVAKGFETGFDETTPLQFRSPYGCSKGAIDQYMLDYSATFGLKTIVFRHSSMYGGRQFATYDQGWIGWFCQKALEQKSLNNKDVFTISGNGKQVRDLLHADDMIRLYFSTIDTNNPNAFGTAYNIGGGSLHSMSILELLNWLSDHIDVTLNYEKIPPRLSDQKVFVADITKASHTFNWRPNVSSDAGLKRMVEWINSI